MAVREEIVIGSTADTRGFKKAETAADKLSKTVKALGVSLTAYAAVNFFKTSAKAFAEDQLAATRLNQAVKNLGLEFANPYITDYIANLEKTSKVADDKLRPAFQRLLQQTGSIAKSQDILSTAIEVSRGSTVDLATVSEDLARAYYGNTKGLKKYSLGLTAAELQAKSFSEIQDILNKKFAGSSQVYLSTYAGQLDAIALAFNNMKESAGKAFFILASGGTNSTAKGASNFAAFLENEGRGMERLATILNNAVGAVRNAFGAGATALELTKGAPAAKPGQELFRTSMSNDAALKKIEAQQAKLYKEQMSSLKKITAEQKKQALLKKASTVFDAEQANIIAGLKKNISEDERRRLELQFALLTGNTEEASRLTKELALAQGLGLHLANYLASLPDAKNPFESWAAYLDAIQAKINAITMGSVITPATNIESNYAGNYADAVRGLGAYAPAPAASQAPIQIVIDSKVVAEATQNQSLNGNYSYINRSIGNFG